MFIFVLQIIILKFIFMIKETTFTFFTMSLLYLFTNLHKCIFNNTVINQIIRFSKIYNNEFNFNKQVYKFFENLFYDNNYSCKFLKHYIK